MVMLMIFRLSVFVTIALGIVTAKKFLGSCNYAGFCEQKCRRMEANLMECYCNDGYRLKIDGRRCEEGVSSVLTAGEDDSVDDDDSSPGSGSGQRMNQMNQNCDNEGDDCDDMSPTAPTDYDTFDEDPDMTYEDEDATDSGSGINQPLTTIQPIRTMPKSVITTPKPAPRSKTAPTKKLMVGSKTEKAFESERLVETTTNISKTKVLTRPINAPDNEPTERPMMNTIPDTIEDGFVGKLLLTETPASTQFTTNDPTGSPSLEQEKQGPINRTFLQTTLLPLNTTNKIISKEMNRTEQSGNARTSTGGAIKDNISFFPTASMSKERYTTIKVSPPYLSKGKIFEFDNEKLQLESFDSKSVSITRSKTLAFTAVPLLKTISSKPEAVTPSLHASQKRLTTNRLEKFSSSGIVPITEINNPVPIDITEQPEESEQDNQVRAWTVETFQRNVNGVRMLDEQLQNTEKSKLYNICRENNCECGKCIIDNGQVSCICHGQTGQFGTSKASHVYKSSKNGIMCICFLTVLSHIFGCIENC